MATKRVLPVADPRTDPPTSWQQMPGSSSDTRRMNWTMWNRGMTVKFSLPGEGSSRIVFWAFKDKVTNQVITNHKS